MEQGFLLPGIHLPGGEGEGEGGVVNEWMNKWMSSDFLRQN